MKIPDSIKKKAEALAGHVADRECKVSGEPLGNFLWHKLFEANLECYLQCYRDLVAGEPDYMIANQHGEFLPWTPSKGTLEEDRPSLVLYRDLGVAEFDLKVLGGAKDGWRITPVTLLKMEDES